MMWPIRNLGVEPLTPNKIEFQVDVSVPSLAETEKLIAWKNMKHWS